MYFTRKQMANGEYEKHPERFFAKTELDAYESHYLTSEQGDAVDNRV